MAWYGGDLADTASYEDAIAPADAQAPQSKQRAYNRLVRANEGATKANTMRPAMPTPTSPR
ncbi:MAG: hypothetical protein R2854_19500 [Caldilineaceae bacterium]